MTVLRNGPGWLEAEGHASGSAEACAGISAILYALAGFLAGEYGAGPEITLEAGHARIACRDSSARIEAAFEMARVGLAQIEMAYPEQLRVTPGKGAD